LSETTNTAQDRLSEDLGVDVVALEQMTRLQLDLLRMDRSDPTELGYVFIDRQDNPDAVVVYASRQDALDALDDDPLIEDLCAEDSLDVYVPDEITRSDLASREVILPN
jgi:ABC-type Fe2+-enterobactin transport system substrate-binding protein